MRDHPSALMLFAAGFGTRMRPLTDDRPKPLVEVAGHPLIDHAIALTEGHGLTLVANAHYRAAQLDAHLAPKGIPVLHEDPILDTGGGLRNALPRLGTGPVFTLNTDAVWHGPDPIAQLLDAWDPTRMEALLLCIPPARALGHKGKGDFVQRDDGSATWGPGLVYSGLQILKTDRLAEVEEDSFSLRTPWQQMIDAHSLHILEWPGTWCDVGQPESIALAETLLQSS